MKYEAITKFLWNFNFFQRWFRHASKRERSNMSFAAMWP